MLQISIGAFQLQDAVGGSIYPAYLAVQITPVVDFVKSRVFATTLIVFNRSTNESCLWRPKNLIHEMD